MRSTAAWPDEETLIPDLIRTAPQAREVLDRYGLRGCGGRLGPMETLGYFARAHEVPLAPLLAELRTAISQQPATLKLPLVETAPPQAADVIYRPFFKAGIAVVLTLGALWGAYLLLQIAFKGEFTAAGVHDINAHGHAQIFGWVGLFVMGFAYQAFPRFKHTSLAWPRLAFATWGMMLAGLVIRSIAQPLAVTAAWAWWPAIAASVLEVAAVALFATIIGETWRRSRKGLTFYDGYILAALFWFVVQAVYESIYLAATLSAQGDQLLALVATWQPALRDIQIHGFALLMILGVSQRIFHHFYGLREPNATLSRVMLVVLNAAVAGEVAGSILRRTSGEAWAWLWYGSAVTLAAATVTLVANWRIFAPTAEADRSLKFLRAAYVWLFLSLGMLVMQPFYQHGLLALFAPDSAAARLGFSHAYYGAIRHAITVGFVSLMIVGVAAKVVPTLNGIHARQLSPLWGPFVLINLGCGLRVIGQTATDFTTLAFPVAGVSGLLEVTGLALWGVHLWLVMSGRAKLRTGRTSAEPEIPFEAGAPIQGGHTVGAVLEKEPELLGVFLNFGFTMLTSPQLRRSIARVVTIEKACQRTGVDLEAFLHALNRHRHVSGGCGECKPVHQTGESEHSKLTANRANNLPIVDRAVLPIFNTWEEPAMQNELTKLIVVEGHCDCCGSPGYRVHHANFPELRVTAATVEEAAERLAKQLEGSLDTVSEPSHRDPVLQAISEVREFLSKATSSAAQDR